MEGVEDRVPLTMKWSICYLLFAKRCQSPVRRAQRFDRPRDLSFIVPKARDHGGSEAALHGDHLSLFTCYLSPS
jgi:hypothetical protein